MGHYMRTGWVLKDKRKQCNHGMNVVKQTKQTTNKCKYIHLDWILNGKNHQKQQQRNIAIKDILETSGGIRILY